MLGGWLCSISGCGWSSTLKSAFLILRSSPQPPRYHFVELDRRPVMRFPYLLSALILATTLPLGLALPANAEFAEVDAVSLSIRSGPGSDHPIIDLVFSRDRVEVVERDGNWAKIQGETFATGWVLANGLIENISAEANPTETTTEPSTEVENDLANPASPNTDLLNSQTALAQIEELYPEQLTALQSDCSAPNTLLTETYTARSGITKVSFYCWYPVENEFRTGQWLGTLPAEADPTFGAELTCVPEDAICNSLLAQLRADYANELAAAELNCATKQGNLFLVPLTDSVNVRCGFFATTVYDSNQDGVIDYEDPVSVDTSMFSADIMSQLD